MILIKQLFKIQQEFKFHKHLQLLNWSNINPFWTIIIKNHNPQYDTHINYKTIFKKEAFFLQFLNFKPKKEFLNLKLIFK